MTARISVDRAACKLHAECAAQAPDVFSFDAAGNLTYREEVSAAEAATNATISGSFSRSWLSTVTMTCVSLR